jgi:hypothetical protein
MPSKTRYSWKDRKKDRTDGKIKEEVIISYWITLRKREDIVNSKTKH